MSKFTLTLNDEEAFQLYFALSHFLKLHADKYLPIEFKAQMKNYTIDEFNLLELKLNELRNALEEKGLYPTMNYV